MNTEIAAYSPTKDRIVSERAAAKAAKERAAIARQRAAMEAAHLRLKRGKLHV